MTKHIKELAAPNPYVAPTSARRRSHRHDDQPSSFQVVGRMCEVCEKRVSTTMEGVGCVACRVAYHVRCLAEPDHCIRGGHSMRAMELEVTEREAAQASAAIRLGRAMVWSSIGSVVVCEALLVLLHLGGGRAQDIAADVIRIAISAVLFWRVLAGSASARRALAILSGAGAAVAAVVAVTVHLDLPFVVAISMVGVSGAFTCWVFGLSAAAGAYIDAFGPKRPHGVAA